MAAYGSQIAQGKSEPQATAYLKALFHNVAVQDKSARDALQTFTGGKGDVLISYENEAIAAQQAGEKIDYVVPDQTILIENPIAVTKGASSKAQRVREVPATRPQAQGIFASKGYRPVVKGAPGASKFPTPKKLFTIQKFGGWSTVIDQVLRPGQGHRCRDREGPRCQHHPSELTAGPLPSASARGAASRRRRARAWRGDDVPERDRAAAAGGGRGQVARRRPQQLLGRRDRAGGGRRVQADADRLADRRRDQRGDRAR